jgi:hypothetical protein
MSALLPPAARRPLPASGVGHWLREGVARRQGRRRNWARMSAQQQQPPETHNQPTDWCRKRDRSIKGSDTPQRRRGTDHEGQSTCVALHPPQHARRGVTERTPSSIRTSRGRAYPHGPSRPPEQAGHASTPAARSASNRCSLSAVESITNRSFTHAAEQPSRPPLGGEGAACVGTPTRSRRPSHAAFHPAIVGVPGVSSASMPSRAETELRSTLCCRPHQPISEAGADCQDQPDRAQRSRPRSGGLDRPRRRS